MGGSLMLPPIIGISPTMQLLQWNGSSMFRKIIPPLPLQISTLPLCFSWESAHYQEQNFAELSRKCMENPAPWMDGGCFLHYLKTVLKHHYGVCYNWYQVRSPSLSTMSWFMCTLLLITFRIVFHSWMHTEREKIHISSSWRANMIAVKMN